MQTVTAQTPTGLERPTFPYPGLRHYTRSDTAIFFGRNAQISELLDLLQSSRFIAVVGPSGCGKSSLVRAGLLPRLEAGFDVDAGTAWHLVEMRPGRKPHEELANAVLDSTLFDFSGDADLTAEQLKSEYAPIVLDQLRSGPLGFVDVLNESEIEDHENVLVVVDQFEELFRYSETKLNPENEPLDEHGDESAESPSDSDGEDEDDLEKWTDAQRFVRLLLDTFNQRDFRVYVVITMRSDFLGACQTFRNLPEALNRSLYLTPRLKREEIRKAIEGPLELCGDTIDPSVVTNVLNEVGSDPDQLPLMQHALMRMWTRALRRQRGDSDDAVDPDGDGLLDEVSTTTPFGADATKGSLAEGIDARGTVHITMDDYERVGGLLEALDQHAQSVYEVRIPLGTQAVCEDVFRCLVRTTARGHVIRDPKPYTELIKALRHHQPSEIRIVIEQFRSPGRTFLLPPPARQLSDNSVIDITHESLIRKWKTLENWANDEANRQKTAAVVREKFKAWLDHNGQEAYLLSELEIAEARRWLYDADDGEVPGNDFKAESLSGIRVPGISEEILAYIRDSQDFHERPILAEERAERAHLELRLYRARVGFGLGAFFVAASIFLAYWLYSSEQKQQKQTAEKRAEQFRVEQKENVRLKLLDAGRLKLQQARSIADKATKAGNPHTRLLLAAEAKRRLRDIDESMLKGEGARDARSIRQTLAAAAEQFNSFGMAGVIVAGEVFSSPVTRIAYHRGHHMLVAGTQAGEIKAWMTHGSTSTPLRDVPASGDQSSEITALQFSHPGSTAAAEPIWLGIGDAGGRLRLCSCDGKSISDDDTKDFYFTRDSGEADPVIDIQFDLESQFVVVGLESGGVMLADLSSGTHWPIKARHQGAVTDVARDKEHNLFATVGADGRVLFWKARVETAEKLIEIPKVFRDRADGARTRSSQGPMGNGGLEPDPIPTETRDDGAEQHPDAHRDRANDVDLVNESPGDATGQGDPASQHGDRVWIATAGEDQTVIVRRASLQSDDEGKEQLKIAEHVSLSCPASVTSVEFSDDARWLAASCQHQVHVWRLPSPGAPLNEITRSGQIRSMAQRQDGETAEISRVIFTRDTNQLIALGADGQIALWKMLDEGPSVESVTLEGHEGPIYDLSVAGLQPGAEESILYTAGEDRTVRQWDLNASHVRLSDAFGGFTLAAQANGHFFIGNPIRWKFIRVTDGSATEFTLDPAKILPPTNALPAHARFNPGGDRLCLISNGHLVSLLNGEASLKEHGTWTSADDKRFENAAFYSFAFSDDASHLHAVVSKRTHGQIEYELHTGEFRSESSAEITWSARSSFSGTPPTSVRMTSLRSGPDRRLAVAYESLAVHVFSPLHPASPDGFLDRDSKSSVTQLEFSADGRLLFCRHLDGHLKAFDLGNHNQPVEERLMTLIAPGDSGQMMTPFMTPARYPGLIASRVDGSLKTTIFTDGINQRHDSFQQSDRTVTALGVSNGGRWLLTSGQEAKSERWSIDVRAFDSTSRHFGEPVAHVRSTSRPLLLAINQQSDGPRGVAVTSDGSLLEFNLQTTDVDDRRLGALCGRNLTASEFEWYVGIGDLTQYPVTFPDLGIHQSVYDRLANLGANEAEETLKKISHNAGLDFTKLQPGLWRSQGNRSAGSGDFDAAVTLFQKADPELDAKEAERLAHRVGRDRLIQQVDDALDDAVAAARTPEVEQAALERARRGIAAAVEAGIKMPDLNTQFAARLTTYARQAATRAAGQQVRTKFVSAARDVISTIERIPSASRSTENSAKDLARNYLIESFASALQSEGPNKTAESLLNRWIDWQPLPGIAESTDFRAELFNRVILREAYVRQDAERMRDWIEIVRKLIPAYQPPETVRVIVSYRAGVSEDPVVAKKWISVAEQIEALKGDVPGLKLRLVWLQMDQHVREARSLIGNRAGKFTAAEVLDSTKRQALENLTAADQTGTGVSLGVEPEDIVESWIFRSLIQQALKLVDEDPAGDSAARDLLQVAFDRMSIELAPSDYLTRLRPFELKDTAPSVQQAWQVQQFERDRWLTRLSRRGAIQQAIAYVHKVTSIDPVFRFSSVVLNDFCWSACLTGAVDETIIEAGRRAVTEDPTNASFRDTLGLARAVAGVDLEKAIDDFQIFINANGSGVSTGTEQATWNDRSHWIDQLKMPDARKYFSGILEQLRSIERQSWIESESTYAREFMIDFEGSEPSTEPLQ